MKGRYTFPVTYHCNVRGEAKTERAVKRNGEEIGWELFRVGGDYWDAWELLHCETDRTVQMCGTYRLSNARRIAIKIIEKCEADPNLHPETAWEQVIEEEKNTT